MRRLITASFLLAVLAGCSTSAFEGAVGKSEKDDDEDDAKEAGDDGDVVGDPEMVAGAFLTCEKTADAPEADPTKEMTVGCYVNDDKGHVDVTPLSPAWAVKDAAGTSQTLKNPADLGAYHMTFILPKDVVNTYTVSVRLSEGGSTKEVAVKLTGIETGVVTSKPHVIGFEVTESNSVCELSFVEGTGDFSYDWPNAQIKVFGLVNVSLCYVLSLSDGTKQEGQVLYQGTEFKNEGGGQLPGVWDHVVDYDFKQPSLAATGVTEGVIPSLADIFTVSKDLISKLPKFGFTGLLVGKIKIAGKLPVVVE